MQICEALRSYDGFSHSVYCTHSRVWSVAQELMSPLASFSEINSDVPGPVAAVACANYMDYAVQSDVTLRMWQEQNLRPEQKIWRLYSYMTVIWCYMTVVTKRCSGQSRAKRVLWNPDHSHEEVIQLLALSHHASHLGSCLANTRLLDFTCLDHRRSH